MKLAFVAALVALCVACASACPSIAWGGCYWWYSPTARDNACPNNQICSRSGGYNLASNYRESNTGACGYWCCHNVNHYTLKEGDVGCYKAGTSRADRDNRCQGEMVCARYGHDGRYYGCSNNHCCANVPVTCSISNPSYGWASATSNIMPGQTSWFYCNAGYDASPSSYTCPSSVQTSTTNEHSGTVSSTDSSMLGWELAAKISSGSAHWKYDSGWWTNGATFNTGSDTKTWSFNNRQSNALRLVMISSGVSRVIDWHHNWYQTLHTIFNWGEQQTYVTSVSNWRWIVPSVAYQHYCNRQGTNIWLGNRARLGLIMNQENDCWSPDSAIGVGLGSVSAGGYCGCCASWGTCTTRNAAAQIYVLTNDIQSTFTCTPKSCYLNQNSMTSSFVTQYNSGAVYTVDCDTGYTSHVDADNFASTQISCGASGLFLESQWKLALQIKGDMPTFRYDNEIWTNTERLDANGEKKTDAYFQAASRVKIVMNYNNVDREFEWNWGRTATLHSVMSGNEWTTTMAAASTWRQMMTGAGVQNYCNRQGINVMKNQYKVRMGIIMNQENDCNTPDSSLGLGLSVVKSGSTPNVDMAAGSYCGCCQNSGSCNNKVASMATVFVRTNGRTFNRYGNQVCQRRACSSTSTKFIGGWFSSNIRNSRVGDNVAYECFKGFRKGSNAMCQNNGKITGMSCTENSCSGPSTMSYQNGPCMGLSASSYDFVHTVTSDSITFPLMSKPNDLANDGSRVHTATVTLTPYTDYMMDIDAVYSDMGDNGEYISQVNVNGVNLNKCGGNAPGYDNDCSTFACKRGHEFRTGSDGKVTVTMTALNMYASCRCSAAGNCYNGNLNSNYPRFYMASKIMIKPASAQQCNWQCYLDRYADLQNAFGATNVDRAMLHYQQHGLSEGRNCKCPDATPDPHSNCNAYCASKGAVCVEGVTSKTGTRIGCDGSIPEGESYCYCNTPSEDYSFLGNGCCRGGAATSWAKQTDSATYTWCQQQCDKDPDCNAIEVNGCGAGSNTNNKCNGACYKFFGNKQGNMIADSCVTNGDQKCYRKPVAGGNGALAISVDGNTDTFKFDRAIWYDDSVLDSGNNKKTKAYFSKSSSFKFEFLYGGITRSFVWKPPSPMSLKEIFNKGQWSQTLTSVGTWRTMINGVGYQNHCNYQGFNLQQNHGRKARVGIVFNEQNHCGSPDAHMGIGLNDMGAGGSCGCCVNGGSCSAKKAIARIYASVSHSRRQTCPYLCIDGYEKNGMRTCEATTAVGSMSGGGCVASKCTTKSTIANLQRECNGYGTMRTHNTCNDWTCQPGYTKSGGTRTCNIYGRLDGGRCDANPCTRNLDFRVMSYTLPSSHCNDGGVQYHGSVCTFRCAEGYSSPTNSVRCNLGNWVTPLPQCTPNRCDISNVQIANGFYEAEEWNLAVQVDGNSNVFKYAAALWTNTETIDDGNNKKTAAFFSTANKFRIEMEFYGTTQSFEWSPNSPTSLHTLMNQGQTSVTLASKEKWRTMIHGVGYQNNCNYQGFNLQQAHGRKARIGIVFNEQNNCGSPDAHMGIGLNDIAAGGSCGCCVNGGSCSTKTVTARIYALTVIAGSIPDQARVPVKCINEDWSLALDIDGANSNTFKYDGAAWTSTDLVDDGINKKTSAFFKGTKEIKVQMIYGGTTKEFVWKMTTKKSLYDLFTGGEWQTSVTDASTWKAMIGGAGVQNHCNRQGVNINLGNRARLGIVMNQENDCRSPDSALGLGLSSMAAGSYCGCCQNSGSCNQKKARARVYVKNSGGMRKPSGTGEMLCIKGELDIPRCEKVVFKAVNRLETDVYPLDSAHVVEGNCGDMKMNKKAGSGALGKVKVATYGQCCNLCTNTEGCTYFTFYEDGRCTMDGGKLPQLQKAKGAMVSTAMGGKAQFLVVDTIPNCNRVSSVRADKDTRCDAARLACEKDSNCQYVVYSYQGDTCDAYNYCPGDNSPIQWPAGPRPSQPSACATGFSPGNGCPGTCTGKTVNGLTEMECMEECLDTPMCSQFAHDWNSKVCTLCESEGVPSSTTVEFYDISGDERIVYEAPRRSTCSTVGAGFQTCTSGDSKYTQVMVDSACTASEDEFGEMCPEGVTCPTGAAFTAVDAASPEGSCVAMCDATPGCKFATLTANKCFLTKQCDTPVMKPGAKVFVSGGFWQQMDTAMPDNSVILDAGNRNNPDSRFTSPISGKVTAAKVVYSDGLVSCRNCDFAKYKTVCDISASGASIESVTYNGARVKVSDTITFDAVAGGDLAIKATGNGGCGSARVSLSCTSGNSAWNELRSNTNNFVAAAFKADADMGNNENAFQASFDRPCESGSGIWSSDGKTVVLRTRAVMTVDDDCKKPSLSDGTASYWGCGSGENAEKNLATYIVRGSEQVFPSNQDPRFGFEKKKQLPTSPQACVKVVDDSLANKVMTPSERHYVYEVTVGRKIYQTDTNSGQRYFLGNYNSQSDLSKPADQEHFNNGDGCPGGIKRESTIKFLCGKNEAVVSASEPSMCKYEFKISTPACCEGGTDDVTMGAADSTADKYTVAGLTQLDDKLILYGSANVKKGDQFTLQHGIARGGYGKTEAYVYMWFNGGKYNSLGHEFYLSMTPLKTPEGAVLTKALYSYFDTSNAKHFLSTSLDKANKNVRNEGTLGYMFTNKVGGSVPVFEYQNKIQNDKQYTVNVAEYDGNADYTKLGTVGYAMINADGSEAPPCDTSEVVIDDGYMPSCPPSIEHGQTCGFTCNSGFKPENTGKISCNKGKLTLDNCIAMSCPMDFMKTINFEDENWAETTCSEQPIQHLKSCSVTCAFGYHPTDADGNLLPAGEGYKIKLGCAYGVRTVAGTKMDQPVCGPDKCEAPGAIGTIPNGNLRCDGSRHGSKCTLTCDINQNIHAGAYKNGRYHPNFFGAGAGGGVSRDTDMKCQNGVIVPLVTDKKTKSHETCDWLHTAESRVFCRRAEKMPILAEANDIDQCRAECCQQKGCRAMAFDSRTRVCSLYDAVLDMGECEPSDSVVTNNRGMTCQPNSCDTSRLVIKNGKHNCGKNVGHANTCTLTCKAGYHAEFRGTGKLNKKFNLIAFSGNGNEPGIGDVDGNGARDKGDRTATMKCMLGQIKQMVCKPDPCYMPVRVNQIEKMKSHNCPLRLQHGKKCQFKCQAGYHSGPVNGMGTNAKKATNGIAHGTLKCDRGLTNMQDCIENSCNAFEAMDHMKSTNCEREVFGSTSCRFMCKKGYEPSGEAELVSAPVCEKSRCDLKRKFSDTCDEDYGETNCWDSKTGAQADSGVQYGVIFCDRGVLEEETCVKLTDEDEDGLYDNLFNRPLTTTDGLEYDKCPFDPDNDVDEDGICGDIDICPNDPKNDEDADGWCAKVDSYNIAWNFDWTAQNEVGKVPRGFNGLAGWDVEGKGIKWAPREEVECFETVLDKEGTKGISCTLDYGERKCKTFDGEVVSYPADTTDEDMSQNVRRMQENLHLCNDAAQEELKVLPLPQPEPENVMAMSDLTSDWKLALKIDGRSNVFTNDNAYWENDEVVDDGQNEKTDYYFEESGELKLVLEYGDSVEEFLWMHEDDEFSLKDLFAGEEQLIDLQTPSDWAAMIPDAGVQNHCNRQGINVQIGQKVRMGIIMNQENDCNSPDSAIGIGMRSLSAGSYCGCCQNAGTCNTKKATAKIYIRPLKRENSFLDPCNSAPGYTYCPTQDQCIKPGAVVCEPRGAQFFKSDLAACEGGHSINVAVKNPSDLENKKGCESFADQTCTTFPASGWFRRYQKEYAKLVQEATDENWHSDLALPDGMMASTAEGTGVATSIELKVASSAITFVIGGQADENDVVVELLTKVFGEEDFSVSIMSKPELLADDDMYHVEWDLSPVIPTNFGEYRDDFSDEKDGVDMMIRVRDESPSGSIQIDNFRFFDAVSGCVPECFTIVRGNQPSAGKLDQFSTEIVSSEVDCTDYGVDEGDCFFLEDHTVPYLIEKIGMEENSGMFCLHETIPGDFGAPSGIGMARHGLTEEFLALQYFPRCLFIDYTDWPKTYIAAENKDEFSDGMVYLYDQQNADLFCYDGKYQDKPQCAFFSAALQVFRRFEGYECTNHDLLQKEHFDPVTGQNIGSHLLFDGGELVFWLCGEQALDAPVVDQRDLTRRETKLSRELFTGKPSLDTVMWVENNCVPAGINTNPKYRKFSTRSPKECATACLNNPICTSFEYSNVKEIRLADGSAHVLKNCWTFMDKECDPLWDTESVTESSDPEQPRDLYIFHNTNANLAPRAGVSLIQKEKKVYRKGTKEMKMRQLRPRRLPKRAPLRRLFNAFDADGSRRLVVSEVADYLGVVAGYAMNENDVAILVKEVDGDLSGDLKFREFRQLFKRSNLPGNFKSTLKAAKKAFLDFEEAQAEGAEGPADDEEDMEGMMEMEMEGMVDLESVSQTSGMKTMLVGGVAVVAVVALVAVTKTVFKRKKTGMRIIGGANYGTDEV